LHYLFLDDYTSVDDDSQVILSYLKSSAGKYIGLPTMVLFLLVSWLSLFLYIFMLITSVIRYKKESTSNTNKNNSSVNIADLKRAGKMTVVLGYNGIVYLIMAPISFTNTDCNDSSGPKFDRLTHCWFSQLASESGRSFLHLVHFSSLKNIDGILPNRAFAGAASVSRRQLTIMPLDLSLFKTPISRLQFM